jgi:anhydro-N-acetylmuramic acid kinase
MDEIRKVLGIMTGTSIDGADFVLTGFSGERPRLIRSWSRPFPSSLHQRLIDAATDRCSSWETARLHHDLGRFLARAALSGLRGARPDAVGLHGQTMFHSPSAPAPATYQLGEPAYLAEALRIPVVSNFRVSDIAAGGEGAPMATLFHVEVFGRRNAHLAVQNLGGISNVTSIEWRHSPLPKVMAFDTGPGNMLLDGAIRVLTGDRIAFDRGGRLAAHGRADESLVAQWLRHPFFRRPPPKSTGREQFGAAYLSGLWKQMSGYAPTDRMASLAELTARSIALNYRLHLRSIPDRVILCGGGVANRDLVRRIQAAMAGIRGDVEVVTCAELGWPPRAIEGAAFALLARERLLGWPGNYPDTTRARRTVLCGKVTAP